MSVEVREDASSGGLRGAGSIAHATGPALATMPQRATGGFPFLVGEHPLIEKVQALVAKLAATDTTVLISGESGTGKELAARALHVLSARASRPFLSINCGAIPGELLESELFGHERGAFTGATAARQGLLQLAHGGTVFLDEIAEMPPPLQVKLLRVLQDWEVRPVGADTAVKIDVRVIAATNKDLQRAMQLGMFREDLFYRLQVIPVDLPPLRERRADIPVLAAHFLAKQMQRCPDRPTIRISAVAMAQLWEYDWPGNVRELENLIERLVVLADDPVIGADDLPAEVRTFISEKRIPRLDLPEDGIDLNKAVLEFEHHLITEALRRTKGNKQAAARLLGLGRTTLVAKLHRLPVEVPKAS
jgi:transcriptional regulator with PAS, ATPase and Fis domain